MKKYYIKYYITSLICLSILGGIAINMSALDDSNRENTENKNIENLTQLQIDLAQGILFQNLAAVVVALDEGADVNYLYNKSSSVFDFDELEELPLTFTPVQLAIIELDFPITQLLLERGANPNLENKEGATSIDMLVNIPTHFINTGEARKRIPKFIKLLKFYKANMNGAALNKIKDTLLHKAARSNNVSAINIFKNDISVNIPNEKGNTPLMEAAKAGSKAAVRALLLIPTIDLSKENAQEKTALVILHDNKIYLEELLSKQQAFQKVLEKHYEEVSNFKHEFLPELPLILPVFTHEADNLIKTSIQNLIASLSTVQSIENMLVNHKKTHAALQIGSKDERTGESLPQEITNHIIGFRGKTGSPDNLESNALDLNISNISDISDNLDNSNADFNDTFDADEGFEL